MRGIAIAITGASGAIYATRTLAALLERGCHVELIVSDYGRRLLRDELAFEFRGLFFAVFASLAILEIEPSARTPQDRGS